VRLLLFCGKSACFSLSASDVRAGHVVFPCIWQVQHTAGHGPSVDRSRAALFTPTSNSFATAELLHVRNALPDEVTVQRIDERLSALGNTIVTNDYVALIHPDIDRVRC
jgi:eIF-6 family